MERIKEIIEKLKAKTNIQDIYARNKYTAITSILILNYLMICFLIDKNPFDIIPSWPVSDDRAQVKVYLPDIDGDAVFAENRLIEKNEDSEIFIKKLVKFVVQGSDYENTKSAGPSKGDVRKGWIYNKDCIIDLYYGINHKSLKIVKTREQNFKNALTKTIKENVPGIEKVIVLTKGIPHKKLW
jgi:hypothetical protein